MITRLHHPIKYGLTFIAIGCAFPLIAMLHGKTEYQIVDQVAPVGLLCFYLVSFILWACGAYFLLGGIIFYLRGREPKNTI